MPETDTYRELAARLGWEYQAYDDGYVELSRPATVLFHKPDAHAVIEARAAEALRETGWFVMNDDTYEGDVLKDEWVAIKSPRGHYQDLNATDYPTALLAALTLAGIGGDDAE